MDLFNIPSDLFTITMSKNFKHFLYYFSNEKAMLLDEIKNMDRNFEMLFKS